jgi:hypothetical protein
VSPYIPPKKKLSQKRAGRVAQGLDLKPQYNQKIKKRLESLSQILAPSTAIEIDLSLTTTFTVIIILILGVDVSLALTQL